MQVTRLLLRNYRVFADELALEVPPGLIGVYGPNGAGKSTLVESIPWVLFGSSRTGNDEVRTSGVDGESLAEVELEHEGHHYRVRRTVSGINSTVRASAYADGHQVADGARDTGRFVRSVLGIDDAAFRASVFAEQKQLAAFAGTTPAKRRDLVLRLLGITPLDAARDRARSDARSCRADLERLRALLPDLEALNSATTEAEQEAAAARARAGRAAEALGLRRRSLAQARRESDEWSVREVEHGAVVAEGRQVRAQYDGALRRVTELQEELDELVGARRRLSDLEVEGARLPQAEARLEVLRQVRRAEEALAALGPAGEGAGPTDAEEAAAASAVEQARAAAEQSRSALASADAVVVEAEAARARAAAALDQSGRLSGEADCPLCGQALGEAFEQVRAHRRTEAAVAASRVVELGDRRAQLARESEEAAARAEESARNLEELRRRRAECQAAGAERRRAEEALELARLRLGGPPDPGDHGLEAEVGRLRRVVAESHQLRGRLERVPRAETELEEQRQAVAVLVGRLDALREKRRALGFRPEALATARLALAQAEEALEEADGAARAAEVAAARADGTLASARASLAAARDQHAHLGELAEQTRHLARLAELMGAFRNQLVGAVGPRLSRQAASLFAELTDAEYDELVVDGETYGIRIVDQGVPYELDRFSGSETDLASLALRVAISEHLCFQSGGQVGLLVLDEVFGPLDADRKDHMLRALERLKGRFRQVLVVTHDTEIKDQLPGAIEVVKLPGRRATARLIAAT